jgi:hypothetical protein
MKDLFGNEITLEEARRLMHRKRDETPKGYAARPGTGPPGETCRTCAHCCARSGDRKTFYKCELLKHLWTNSYGTDIRLKSPACAKWENDVG